MLKKKSVFCLPYLHCVPKPKLREPSLEVSPSRSMPRVCSAAAYASNMSGSSMRDDRMFVRSTQSSLEGYSGPPLERIA